MYMRKLVSTLLLSAAILLPANLRAQTGKILNQFNTPAQNPTGMTFDGKHLWLADRTTDKIYCINPENGKVVRSI